MGIIIEITYAAKCKDCKFIKPKTFGKMRRHICTNPESPRFDPHGPYFSRVTLKDKVCEKWKL